jgi:hypothetical protein
MSAADQEGRDAEAGRILERMRSRAAHYYRLTGKPLGLAGELGEYDAARLLGLRPAPARTPGYDAIDRKGRKLQIKTRVYAAGKNNGQRMGVIRDKYKCHAILLVLLDPDTLKPREIHEAPWTKVMAELRKPGKVRARGDLMIPVFLKISREVWRREA